MADRSVCALATGGLLLLDPDDIKAAFSQKTYSNAPSRFSALVPKNKDRHVAANVAANIPPFLDGQDHITVRSWLVKSIFSTLETIHDSVFLDAQYYVADLPVRTQMYLVEQVGRRFACRAIARFVGVEADTAEMKRFTFALFKLFAPIPDVETLEVANLDLADTSAALLCFEAERKIDRKPSLITALIENADLLSVDDQGKNSCLDL